LATELRANEEPAQVHTAVMEAQSPHEAAFGKPPSCPGRFRFHVCHVADSSSIKIEQGDAGTGGHNFLSPAEFRVGRNGIDPNLVR
jgi:hypothetical protein